MPDEEVRALANPNFRGQQERYVVFAARLSVLLRETERVDEARRILLDAEDVINHLDTEDTEDLFKLAELRASLALNMEGGVWRSLKEPDRQYQDELKDRAMAALQSAVDAGWREPGRLKGGPCRPPPSNRGRTWALVARLEAATPSGTAPPTGRRRRVGSRRPRPLGAGGPRRPNLAMIRQCLGLLQAEQGRNDEATASLRQALVLREALARESPDDPRHALNLAACSPHCSGSSGGPGNRLRRRRRNYGAGGDGPGSRAASRGGGYPRPTGLAARLPGPGRTRPPPNSSEPSRDNPPRVVY